MYNVRADPDSQAETLNETELAIRGGKLCHAIACLDEGEGKQRRAQAKTRIAAMVARARPEDFMVPCRYRYPYWYLEGFNIRSSFALLEAVSAHHPSALKMLKSGANPRLAPGGSADLLLTAIYGSFEEDEETNVLQVFDKLLQAGADPDEPLPSVCIALPPERREYGRSFIASLLEKGEKSGPILLEKVLEVPGFTGLVVSSDPKNTTDALTYARLAGASWAVEPLEHWGRWSPIRRAWVQAVIRGVTSASIAEGWAWLMGVL